MESRDSSDSREPLIIQLYGSGRYNNQGNYHVPPEGLVLPDTIVIPSDLGRRSREDIIAFGKEVGVVPPPSLTRPNAVQRIRDRLMNLGYRLVGTQQKEGEVLKGSPVKIFPPMESKPSEVDLSPEIVLPAFISKDIFRSIASLRSFVEEHHLEPFISIKRGRLREDLERNVREFLSSLKYNLTNNGYVRAEKYVMKAGLTLDQLLTPELSVQVLQETTTIPVYPDDLVKLNRSLSKFIRGQTRWASFDEYSQEMAKLHDLSPELVKVATILNYLTLLTPVNLKGVLRILNKGSKTKVKGLERIYELVRPRYELTMRELEYRIPSRGPALSTITLAKAIEDGYTFTYDQYKEDILNFLGYNRLPQTHLDHLVELFHHYPDFFSKAREFRPDRTLAQEIIRSYYNENPSYVQILYTFVFNYPLQIEEPEEIAARREEFRSLPTRYLETIKRIYRTEDIDNILSRPVHPLELYIIAINKAKLTDLRELVAGFGMVVPEHIVNRIVRSYILLNIPDYVKVITRSEVPSIDEVITKQPGSREQLLDLLAEYTDFEIVERFGYTGGFENRRQLVSNIYETIAEDGFILLKEYDPTLTVNYETTLLTPLEDLPAPYLVYGTPFEYRVVELDELIHSFRYEDNSVVFQHVTGNDHKLYNIAEITRLQSILPSIKAVNPDLSALVDQLMETIRRGILANLRRTAETQRLIQRLSQYNDEEREQVRDLLYSVFYAGMYMRKWLGPGNRYPVKSHQTRGMGTPEPRVVLALGDVGDKLDLISPQLLPEIMKLRIVNYRDDGNINFSNDLLFEEIGPISMGKSCIRVGSKDLILSAYYYISVIFEEIVPDFDPNAVENIA